INNYIIINYLNLTIKSYFKNNLTNLWLTLKLARGFFVREVARPGKPKLGLAGRANPIVAAQALKGLQT
ncbi:MAG: hypothetical protein LBR11_03615, partial [Deltaproteobacteria bacterium]|nr:hypothetical protein [Deltaproteobacteria bacterium]